MNAARTEKKWEMGGRPSLASSDSYLLQVGQDLPKGPPEGLIDVHERAHVAIDLGEGHGTRTLLADPVETREGLQGVGELPPEDLRCAGQHVEGL